MEIDEGTVPVPDCDLLNDSTLLGRFLGPGILDVCFGPLSISMVHTVPILHIFNPEFFQP